MEQVTVKELASEFKMKSSLVLSELKKIGVWVPSSDTLVDSDIANRIRKRLQLLQEAEQEEKERKGEKGKKVTGSPARKSIRELGKPRKKRLTRKVEAEEKPEEVQPPSPLAGSLLPRKGRKAAYRRVPAREGELVETGLEAAEPEHVPETLPVEPTMEAVVSETPVVPLSEALVESVVPTPAEETPETALEAAPVLEEPVAEGEVETAPVPAEEPKQLEPEEAEEEVPLPVQEAAHEAAPRQEVAPEPVIVPSLEAAEAASAPKIGRSAQPPQEKRVEAIAEEEQELAEELVSEAQVPARTKKAVARKKKQKKRDKAMKALEQKEEPIEVISGPREVVFSERVTVKVFAERTGIRSNEIIKALMQQGMLVTMNHLLEQDVVEKLCEAFDVIPSFVTFEEAVAQADVKVDKPEDLVARAPVVTVMGHVDHGKTTLLDFIRNTRVAEGEAGGITQHIGASHVTVGGRLVVFIDTPGHEAFTRMRARGAQATDIVILVVAADDGVMPQTLEAIDHAKAANVPIIVAINKIDKPGAKPERVQQELSDRGLIPEEWGGSTVMVPVSALEGTNVDLLLEMIQLVSEMQELTANPRRAAAGVILEAKMEKGRGTVATLLVQNGTLRVGDIFIAGSTFGRIRAMFTDTGEPVEEAGPSSAIEVLGLQGIPLAGDVFQVVEDMGKAREMVEYRQEKQREQDLAKSSKITSLDDLYAQIEAGEVKELPIVLKTDTQGSAEVLEDTLVKLGTEKVKIDLIHKGVGAITESDVLLASASNAIVIGFNVRPESNARSVAEQENVEIRLYGVIYTVANEVQQAMVGLLEPTLREKYMGRAEVRETFRVPKVGTIAGSYVQDGTLTRNSEVRLLRDNVVIYEGKFGSLKRFKDDVSEVRSGYECGISIENFNDVKIGDVIEAFVNEEIAPQL